MAAQNEGVTKAIASFYWDDWETVFPGLLTIYIPILYLPTFSESNAWDFTLSWPRFPETSLRLPKISDEFSKTSERCRKLYVRRLFPKTFEHFWSYLKDDTFSVLWYDFVRTQKRTESHHVLRTICLDLWVRRHNLSLMREIDVFRQAWLDSRIMRIQYSDGINFDWPKGWQCWTLASKNVRVEDSNTRLEKRRATRNAYEFKFIYSHLFNYNTTTIRKKKK